MITLESMLGSYISRYTNLGKVNEVGSMIDILLALKDKVGDRVDDEAENKHATPSRVTVEKEKNLGDSNPWTSRLIFLLQCLYMLCKTMFILGTFWWIYSVKEPFRILLNIATFMLLKDYNYLARAFFFGLSHNYVSGVAWVNNASF